MNRPRLHPALLTSAAALLLGFTFAACSSSDDETPAPGPAGQPEAGTDADAGTSDDAEAGTDADAAQPDGSTDGDADGGDGGVPSFSCTGKPQATLAFAPGQEQDLQDAVNTLADCTTVQLAAGTFTFDNAVTIRAKGITFAGAGKGAKGEGTGTASSTVLVFANAAANANGLDVVGDLFTVRDLAIFDAKKDALRVETSTDVKIQRVRTEWSQENASTNGAYGIYPVRSMNVLVEDCEAYNAADAGIYVGQTINSIVRNNVAKQNVAGLEIENCRFADVHDNTVVDNTAGLVVFDLPGNPVKGTDIRVHDNTVTGNNRPNFATVSASSSTVSQVPAGTGTFILASRRVELFGNTWGDNVTVDVAVLSGLAIEQDFSKWAAGGSNWGSSDVHVHDNTFLTGTSGTNVDGGNVDETLRPLGALMAALYGYGVGSNAVTRVEPLVWDGIDPNPLLDTTGDNVNICFTDNTLPAGTTYAVADLNFVAVAPILEADLSKAADAWAKTARSPQDPSSIFSCAGFTPALTPVTLP